MENERIWLSKLQKYLAELLKPIITDFNYFKTILGPNGMLYWKRAFTHVSVSSSDNYESLEFYGDLILANKFGRYLLDKFPNSNESKLSELKNHYMGHKPQIEFATTMGLKPYIRIADTAKITPKVVGDVFEAFFGALAYSGDLISRGIGDILCYNYLIKIFESIEIDFNYSKGNNKTNLQQIFSRNGLDAPIEEYPQIETVIYADGILKDIFNKNNIDLTLGTGRQNSSKKSKDIANNEAIERLEEYRLVRFESKRGYTDEDMVKFILRLSPNQMRFLRSNGIDIKNNIIGVGEGSNKDDASDEAYANAMNYLESLGVTVEWAARIKYEREFNNPPLSNYYPQAIAKARNNGFEYIYYDYPNKTRGRESIIISLYGVRPDKTNELLLSLYTENMTNNFIDAKEKLLRKYIQQ